MNASGGRGVAQDDGEAVSWYRRAAEQGDASGQFNLGVPFSYMTPRLNCPLASPCSAARRYHETASPSSCATPRPFSYMTPRLNCPLASPCSAARRYHETASPSSCATPRMYENGRGVAQDDGEAVSWYRRAAEQGDASGQFNLGVMYENGRGVAQDDGEAVSWYRRAAEQGDASGQFNLGVMYENGRGVAQDDGEAVSW